MDFLKLHFNVENEKFSLTVLDVNYQFTYITVTDDDENALLLVNENDEVVHAFYRPELKQMIAKSFDSIMSGRMDYIRLETTGITPANFGE